MRFLQDFRSCRLPYHLMSMPGHMAWTSELSGVLPPILPPLLDRTPQGMIFRDEPTETLVRESYGADTGSLKRVARNLLARQAESVYAAQSLPGLLQKIGDGKKLFNLAFDERFPPTITSTVGQRRIRFARLRAAVLYAADAGDYKQPRPFTR